MDEPARIPNKPLSLTPLELDIMKAVWRRSPITVKEVQAAIRRRRSLAYTTVMTIMHRLYLKGFLNRTMKFRTHYYEPAVSFVDVRDAAVSGVIDHFFQGSKEDLVDFLGGILTSERPAAAEGSMLPSQLDLHPPVALDETLL
jgi:predicted transcriptional regulator